MALLFQVPGCARYSQYTLICVTFSLPPGVRGWLRLLLVALPGLFCLPFYIIYQYRFGILVWSVLAKRWKPSEMTKMTSAF